MAERKLRLVNDSQVKSFTADSVHCVICDLIVPLGGEYDATDWGNHKRGCSRQEFYSICHFVCSTEHTARNQPAQRFASESKRHRLGRSLILTQALRSTEMKTLQTILTALSLLPRQPPQIAH